VQGQALHRNRPQAEERFYELSEKLYNLSEESPDSLEPVAQEAHEMLEVVLPAGRCQTPLLRHHVLVVQLLRHPPAEHRHHRHFAAGPAHGLHLHTRLPVLWQRQGEGRPAQVPGQPGPRPRALALHPADALPRRALDRGRHLFRRLAGRQPGSGGLGRLARRLCRLLALEPGGDEVLHRRQRLDPRLAVVDHPQHQPAGVVHVDERAVAALLHDSCATGSRLSGDSSLRLYSFSESS